MPSKTSTMSKGFKDCLTFGSLKKENLRTMENWLVKLTFWVVVFLYINISHSCVHFLLKKGQNYVENCQKRRENLWKSIHFVLQCCFCCYQLPSDGTSFLTDLHGSFWFPQKNVSFVKIFWTKIRDFGRPKLAFYRIALVLREEKFPCPLTIHIFLVTFCFVCDIFY